MSTAQWLRPSPASGQGSSGTQTIGYVVDPNPGAPRTAAISIFAAQFTVTQNSQSTCSAVITPEASAGVTAAGGSGSISLISSCPWTATSSGYWLRPVTTNGGGSSLPQTVGYVFDANSGAARTATIFVHGATFKVTQVSATTTAAPTITPSSGSYAAPFDLVISGPPGSTTTYSLSPTGPWLPYLGPVSLPLEYLEGAQTVTVRAQSSIPGLEPSPLATASFVVTAAVGEPSPITWSISGANENGFNAAGATVTFLASGGALDTSPEETYIIRNGVRVDSNVSVQSDRIVFTGALASGLNFFTIYARDTNARMTELTVTLLGGGTTRGLHVTNSDGWFVTTGQVTYRLAAGGRTFTGVASVVNGIAYLANVPAGATVTALAENVIAGNAESAFLHVPPVSTWVPVRLQRRPALNVSNNLDFSQGLAGWESVGHVTLVPHQEISSSMAADESYASTVESYQGDATGTRADRPASFEGASAALMLPILEPSGAKNDLFVYTQGTAYSQGRTRFTSSPGTSWVRIRFRFRTLEIPGGYFGTQFDDAYSIVLRSQSGGTTVVEQQSMNSIGLSGFDASGSTAWRELLVPTHTAGDTITAEVMVSNASDSLYDSAVTVTFVEETAVNATLFLRDANRDRDRNGNTVIEPLRYLSASSHSYNSGGDLGSTLVAGSLLIVGAPADTVTAIRLEVLDGGRVVGQGQLVPAAASALLGTLSGVGRLYDSGSEPLFRIASAGFTAVRQDIDGSVNLRLVLEFSGGASRQFEYERPLTKLIKTPLSSAARFGGRDLVGCVGANPSLPCGGDDWALARTLQFVQQAGPTYLWNDFSNMNGGVFRSHAEHKTGLDIDGWFQGYNARGASAANQLIGLVNANLTRIQRVLVAFTPEFESVINTTTLADGRPASQVFRREGSHTTHFHVDIVP